jgi:phosphoglycerate dehydrogenase-like enzyme
MKPDGTFDLGELGLDGLDGVPGIEWMSLKEGPPVALPEQLAGFDAVVLEMMDIRTRSLEGVERLALIARYGVGYDAVDVDACTRAGIIVTNAPSTRCSRLACPSSPPA